MASYAFIDNDGRCQGIPVKNFERLEQDARITEGV